MTDNLSIQQLIQLQDTRQFDTVVVLTDANLDMLYPGYLQEVAGHVTRRYAKIVIPAGEESKSLHQVERICTELMEMGCDKNTCIVNFGGGMVCDLGGFIASIYKRGIAHINYPTTLMAMLDAAIGGKTGVNVSYAKNIVGVIRQPLAVIGPDMNLLHTLSSENLHSGFGEMIKTALIGLPSIFHSLCALDVLSAQSLKEEWIEQCAEFKRKVVEVDPEDHDCRHILNFGHTVGHAIESWLLEQNIPVPHGVAVAEGLFHEVSLSHSHGILPEDEMRLVQRLIRRFYERIDIGSGFDRIMYYMRQDKKNREGRINFTLLDTIGKARPDCLIEAEQVRAFFQRGL
ncbi:MAG: 3-dehydroquinate synthase [Bacteroidales bacterium]|nr:3-dehydroquinate synthase [Bacteroidales bacterium]